MFVVVIPQQRTEKQTELKRDKTQSQKRQTQSKKRQMRSEPKY